MRRRLFLCVILALLVGAGLAGCSELDDLGALVRPASSAEGETDLNATATARLQGEAGRADVEATVTARLQEERARFAGPTPDVEATVTARLQQERNRAPAPGAERDFPTEAEAAARLMPSVVRLSSGSGMGSGLVVGDGLILTNRHVVGEATIMNVQTSTGQPYVARVVARNSILDLALLQFPGVNLPRATFADLSTMKPGDPVLAIGYPLDMKGDASVTRGLFSALRVGEPAVGEWVQTDAAVNPGNSGGPLANLRGEVVGLITLRRITERQAPVQGISFALSANSIGELLPAMRLAAGLLPPEAAPASPELAQEVAAFLKRYDEAESLAFSTSDPTPLRDLSSPVFYSKAAADIRELKSLGIHSVSRLLDFQMRAAYTLPGDLVMADVVERWDTRYYKGETMVRDEGARDLPQIPVVKRTANGWQLLAVHFQETEAAPAPQRTPTPRPRQIPGIPVF